MTALPHRARGVTVRNFMLLLAACCVFGWWFGGAGAVRREPGVLAAAAPAQAPVAAGTATFAKNGFTITPLASFALDARVLAREDYAFDTGAAIAPTDLALGWGRMSDTSVIDRLSISQGGRWWHWTSTDLPMPAREIDSLAANMHMIPANDAVAGALHDVRPGDLVTLRGYLVEARRDDGWRWKSSLSRTDTGGGACELVWVEELRVR